MLTFFLINGKINSSFGVPTGKSSWRSGFFITDIRTECESDTGTIYCKFLILLYKYLGVVINSGRLHASTVKQLGKDYIYLCTPSNF